MSPEPPLFTIVLATRDRPRLFADALESVMRQSFADTEIVVVNDGSAPQALADYDDVLAAAAARLGPRLRSYRLLRRSRGHGQSYSLNYGVEQARGRYVAFLDDDDVWIDNGHLQRAADAILAECAAGREVDLYMSNQEAYRDGQRVPGPVWIEGLLDQLRAAGRKPGAHGAFDVGVPDLMAATGFCHLNCLIVRRELHLAVGGMDERIRWECDREVFLRLVDRAQLMLHHPAVTSRHHVPEPKAGTSMTTSLNELERRLWQLRVLDKSAVGLKHPLLRKHCRIHKGYTLKRIASELARQRAWRLASIYATEGFAVLPTTKWAGFTVLCLLRRLAHPGGR
jgi:glycosyltransferase involved in cell wall biosynthesis